MMTDVKQKPGKAKKAVFQMSVGGVCGVLAIAALRKFLPAGELTADELALSTLGVIYSLSGLLIMVGLSVPKLGEKLLNVEDQDELMEQRRMLAGTSAICLIWGVAQILLLISGPGKLLPAWAGVTFISLGMIMCVGIYYRDRRFYDELIWDITQKASYICFAGLWVLFSVWGAAAMAGLVVVPSPAAIIALFSGGYLLATFVAAGQKGLLETK
jgi:hypothetical protein